MSNMTRRFFAGLKNLITGMQQAKLHYELHKLNDRLLEDMGFSRDLLNQGVKAWPWREEAVNSIGSIADRNDREYRQAVRELRAYSNKELMDMGIARDEIEDAVRHGRPGIDVPQKKAA